MPEEGAMRQTRRHTSNPVSWAAGGRPWSSPWSHQDDETLIRARVQGSNWNQIAPEHLPAKSPNSCRKRHERLMERQNAEQWDGVKLDALAQAYMDVREEMWSILGAQVGERWQVVEQKCMEKGLNNLSQAYQSAQTKLWKPVERDDSGIVMDHEDRIYEPHGNTVNTPEGLFQYPTNPSAPSGQHHVPSIQEMLQYPPCQHHFYHPTSSSHNNFQVRGQPQSYLGATEGNFSKAVTICQATPASDIESSSTCCTESNISDSGNDEDDDNTDGVSRALQDARQKLVDNAMWQLIGWLATHTHTHRGEASISVNARGSTENTESTRGSSSHRTGKRKRAHGSDKEDDEPDHSDNDDNPSKRPRRNGSSEKGRPGSTLRLACPFYKKDPANHMRGSCSGPGWDTVHRVKAHIYRVHSLPLLCPRCQTNVHDHPGLVEHLKAVDQCELRVEPITSTKEIGQPDGLSHDQIETLRKLSQRGRSQCDKWRGIYKFLFAVEDDGDIPSPFYDSSTNTATFADIYQRQLPAIMEAELKRAVEEEMKAMSERLNSRIPELLRNAQRRLIENFNPNSRVLSPPRTRKSPHPLGSARSDSPPCAGVYSHSESTGLTSTGSAVSTQSSITDSTAPLTETTQLTAISSFVLGTDSGHISSLGLDAGNPNPAEHSQYGPREYSEAICSDQGHNDFNDFENAFNVSNNNSYHRNQQIFTPPSLSEGDLVDLDMSKYHEWTSGFNGEFLDIPPNLNWFS